MRNLTNLIFTQEPWDRSELAKLPLNPKALLINCQATLFTEIHTNRSLCPASWQQLMVMLITNRFEMTQLISACGKAATRIAHASWINCVALTKRHCSHYYTFLAHDTSQLHCIGKNSRNGPACLIVVFLLMHAFQQRRNCAEMWSFIVAFSPACNFMTALTR